MPRLTVERLVVSQANLRPLAGVAPDNLERGVRTVHIQSGHECTAYGFQSGCESLGRLANQKAVAGNSLRAQAAKC